MSVIKSSLNVRGDEFRDNEASLRLLVGDLRDKVARDVCGGADEARARHLARGRLLTRDRVDALLDPGTPFLEMSQLGAHGMYDAMSPQQVFAGIRPYGTVNSLGAVGCNGALWHKADVPRCPT
jgi:3-methylcrotonyl-CoA carboxylase beta subunit